MFFKTASLKKKLIRKGILLRAVWGRKTMLTFFDFKPRTVVPAHKHHHEQITYILKGSLKFNLAGKVKILKAGQGVVVPANQLHSAQVLGQPAKILDGWYPIRQDYIVD
jgi:quercetin dioxygenase-like cupin family protein